MREKNTGLVFDNRLGQRLGCEPSQSTHHIEGSEHNLSEVRLKRGEPVEKALRRLKRKLDREGTLREARAHRHFEKPSEKRRRKAKAPKPFGMRIG